MRPDKNRRIVLGKSEDLATFMIVTGATLQETSSDRKLNFEGKSISVEQKEADDIHKFDFDFNEVMDKYLDFAQDVTKRELLLSSEESETLRKSAHAANYFLYNKNPETTRIFKEVYAKYFKD